MLCPTCEKAPDKQVKPSIWFNHIYTLHLMRLGGYPFAADDLTIEEWQDLGIYAEEMMQSQWPM